MDQYLQTINNYINAYNSFDIEGMLTTLHPEIVFKNISEGEVNLTTNGIEEFKAQAEKSIGYFREREQVISDFKIGDEQAEVSIDYRAVLAIDLPNGLKEGETIRLKGKSVFYFKNNLIISLLDYS
jgi:hypothetical protein